MEIEPCAADPVSPRGCVRLLWEGRPRGWAALLFLRKRHAGRLQRNAGSLCCAGVNTLSEHFAALHPARPAEVARRLFWACLHRRGLVLVPILAVACRDFFAADRALLERVARVRTVEELEEEIHDFRTDARNQTWWRKVGRVRVSTRRLRRVVRPYLPAARGGR